MIRFPPRLRLSLSLGTVSAAAAAAAVAAAAAAAAAAASNGSVAVVRLPAAVAEKLAGAGIAAAPGHGLVAVLVRLAFGEFVGDVAYAPDSAWNFRRSWRFYLALLDSWYHRMHSRTSHPRAGSLIRRI